MNKQNRLRIVLLGASLDTGNMGVNVLANASVKCVASCFPTAEISFFDYAKDPSVHVVRLGSSEVAVPTVNIRFSKKLYLPNHIAILLLLALVLRRLPSASLRRWILARNQWLQHIEETNIVLSIAGGDSFSDIYGLRRLLYVSLPQIFCLWMGKELILLPQTIGPFQGAFARRCARYILRGAQRVYGRDQQSVTLARALRGEPQDQEHVVLCHDVGFLLDAIAPKTVDTGELSLGTQDRRVPIVGLNVSGLLWRGGYTHNNMFGLRVDYEKLILDLIDFFIREKGAAVLLVPHVFGTGANSESDALVCNQLWETLSGKYGERLEFLRGSYDQSELKYVIGLCDFFVGSRMHACIAAASQGVPAVSVAYSDKFVGVMGTIGIAANVADARYLTEQEVLALIERAFNRRLEIHQELLRTMPKVRASIMSLLDPAAHACQATPLASDSPRDAMIGADLEGRIHVS